MQAYIRPNATGTELLVVTRVVVFVFGIFAGVICIILNVVCHPAFLAAHVA
jgi:Na+/proline symporter